MSPNGRNNNIQMRQGNNNYLSSSSSHFQNKKDNINYSQEMRLKEKPKIIINNINKINLNNYPKFSNNINLIIDFRKDNNKKRKAMNNLNYVKNNSLLEKNDAFEFLNSKINVLETEPNKLGKNNKNNDFNQKLNQIQNKHMNNEELNENKPSNNILSTYYNNKNQVNKISIKKNKNFNINFNDNIPKNQIKFNNIINGKNLTNNDKTKFQSYTSLNKFVNKDLPKYNALSKEKENLTKIKSEISIKNEKKNKNSSSNNSNRNNLYLKRPLSSFSSNAYLNTENNINNRNSSTRNRFHTNYNLINITSPKERKNTYSNINSVQKTPKLNYQYYMGVLTSHNKRNNNDIQSVNKHQKKPNYNYSFNQNDFQTDKFFLNKYYDETFSDSNNDKNFNNIKLVNKNKFNNDDITYKENLTTDQSTCKNTSNLKIKNLKKTNQPSNTGNFSENEKFENIEDLHFYIVSSLQKGKNTGKFFK